MKIEYLADHQEYINQVNNWLYDEWSCLFFPDSTRQDRLKDLKKRLVKREIPTTFIGLEENKLVGTVSLIEYDMDTHRHLTPWLAGVIVHPDYRRRGIGSKLVTRALTEAKNIGIDELYLFTPDMQDFYLQLDWQVKERTEYKGQQVVIMSYQF